MIVVPYKSPYCIGMKTVVPIGRIFLLLAGLVLILMSFQKAKKRREESMYIIKDGFYYKPQTYDSTTLYTGGAWALYYHLEQEVSVAAQYRRFLKGHLFTLFQLEFNGADKPKTILLERYFHYNVDNLAKPVMDVFCEKIATAPGWKTDYKGTVLLPVKFITMGGRIGIDYNYFVTDGIGYVLVGKK
jgi:hypothetical protein